MTCYETLIGRRLPRPHSANAKDRSRGGLQGHQRHDQLRHARIPAPRLNAKAKGYMRPTFKCLTNVSSRLAAMGSRVRQRTSNRARLMTQIMVMIRFAGIMNTSAASDQTLGEPELARR